MVSVLETEAYHSNCPNFRSFEWKYDSAAIRFASAAFSVAVIVVWCLYFILLSSILLAYNTAVAADRQTEQRTIIEHTEVSIITNTMEYIVPDPLSLRFQKPVRRTYRYWNPHSDWLPLECHDVNDSNSSDVLAHNALHPSGIYGTCLELSTGLLNTMNHPGPNSSYSGVPPPVHTNFLNRDQIVQNPPAQDDANTRHSFATHQFPSYAGFSSNVRLQENTAYSNLPEPQNTLPISGFDPYKTNNMGVFIKEERLDLDSGYSPCIAPPHQQSLNIASNSIRCPTGTADSYNHHPLGPPNIEPQGLASSGTSAALNMSEQHPMSNMLDVNGCEYTTASTDLETFIPPYVATNASISSGRNHFRIHDPLESFSERRLPSETIQYKSQTYSSNSPHSDAASLYLPKIEDFEDTGSWKMDTAMQLTPETRDSNDLDDPSPRHHLIPAMCNYNIANLTENLPLYHTINDHVKQEDLDTSSACMEPPHGSNNTNASISNIWEVSTHTDGSVKVDSNTSVEEDIDHSIMTELDAFFNQITTAGDYSPDCPSTHETGDVNAPNSYNVNSGNNPVASEPGDCQHSKGQVIRDAGSEETQPRRRKHRPRKKANLSEGAQPQRRKHRPRKKPNVLPAEVEHCQETEVPDVSQHQTPSERRSNPKDRYFCLDRDCKYSAEMGFTGFVTSGDAQRHINKNGWHTTKKHYRCTLLHATGQNKQFRRADGLIE